MRPEDDDKKTEAEYLPPEPRDVARRDERQHLPDLPLPSSGLIRSAFLTAVRYRGTAAAVAAYSSAVRESVEAVNALADLDDAVLKQERTRRKLVDAETIHQRDAAKRREKLLKAQQSAHQEEVRAKKADLKRQQELSRLEAQHEHWQGKETGAGGFLDPDDLSPDEKEYYQELKAATAHRRYDLIAKAVIDEFLAGRSENDLNIDERNYIERLKTVAAQLAKDREPLE
jgi:hypothetical protein